jgi:hypothetical protein
LSTPCGVLNQEGEEKSIGTAKKKRERMKERKKNQDAAEGDAPSAVSLRL